MTARKIGSVLLAILLVGTAAQLIAPPVPRLLYNPSLSAPVGWYRLDPAADISPGMKVAAFAPEPARELADQRRYVPENVPLIKTVWAGEGEQVCWEDGVVRVVNHPDLPILDTDDLRRVMPRISGCVLLEQGQYLLISDDVQTSWDSRYFGPVGRENILGPVRYLGPSFWGIWGKRRDLDQGKIKGGSAPAGLTHPLYGGLHIYFGGAPWQGGGTPVFVLSYAGCGFYGSANPLLSGKSHDRGRF